MNSYDHVRIRRYMFRAFRENRSGNAGALDIMHDIERMLIEMYRAELLTHRMFQEHIEQLNIIYKRNIKI